MKDKGCVLLIVVIVIVAALIFWGSSKKPPPAIDQPIGVGIAETPVVDRISESGSVIELSMDSPDDLYRGDRLTLDERAKALLKFGDIHIYALLNSDMQIIAEGSDENPGLINLLLWTGGIICKDGDQDRTPKFFMGEGQEITVLGTDMFLVYNPDIMLTWVGNFDGQVQIKTANWTVDLPAGKHVFVENNQLSDFFPLDFTLQELMTSVDMGFSPIDIMEGYWAFVMQEVDGVATEPPIEVEAVVEETPTE